MAIEPMRRLFTVDEYLRMGETGILRPDDRVELIGGEIVEKAPVNPPHGGTVNRLARLFVTALAERAVVGIQNDVVLDDLTQPQPDLSVARPRQDDYTTAHPRPSDLVLVIEVADTTLRFDRVEKIPRYGRAGVPESWIVNLADRVIEVYREPGPNGYASTGRIGPGETIAPLAFPDLEVSVDELFR